MSDLILLTSDNNYVVNLQNRIQTVTNILSKENDSITEKKFLKLSNIIKEFETQIKTELELDNNLYEYMHETKKNHEVYPANDFQSILNEISDDSLIIYVKKAQLYKVYNSNHLEDFSMDESTCYRASKYGPVYEVVRDANPQKLMIVIQDNVRDVKLQNIKSNIIEFIQKSSKLAASKIPDLKVYDNDNHTEFIVSSIQLKNLQDKENFIDDFILFMKQKGETELAEKIQHRPQPCDLKGVRLYTLPSAKTLIDGKPMMNSLDQLLTTSVNQPIVIQQNTYIITNSTINSNNVINNTINKSSKTPKKTIKSFCLHIYETKPDWYLEDQFIDIDIIEEAYRNYFSDTKTDKKVISRNLKDYLFNKSSRSYGGTTKKKLFTYDVLKKKF